VVSALITPALATPAAGQDLEFPRPISWRIDPDSAAGDVSGETYFVEMPPGWHVTTGPPVALWDPSISAAGMFRTEMEAYLFDPGDRQEPFGLLVGGRALGESDQDYLSFLVREGGEYAVGRRMGSTTQTLIGWTRHPAILSWSERPENEVTVRNTLAVEVREDQVGFIVNGREVVTLVRRALRPTDGIVGIRVGGGLDLHVSRLEVSPGR
jgi:hypothetical protein